MQYLSAVLKKSYILNGIDPSSINLDIPTRYLGRKACDLENDMCWTWRDYDSDGTNEWVWDGELPPSIIPILDGPTNVYEATTASIWITNFESYSDYTIWNVEVSEGSYIGPNPSTGEILWDLPEIDLDKTVTITVIAWERNKKDMRSSKNLTIVNSLPEYDQWFTMDSTTFNSQINYPINVVGGITLESTNIRENVLDYKNINLNSGSKVYVRNDLIIPKVGDYYVDSDHNFYRTLEIGFDGPKVPTGRNITFSLSGEKLIYASENGGLYTNNSWGVTKIPNPYLYNGIKEVKTSIGVWSYDVYEYYQDIPCNRTIVLKTDGTVYLYMLSLINHINYPSPPLRLNYTKANLPSDAIKVYVGYNGFYIIRSDNMSYSMEVSEKNIFSDTDFGTDVKELLVNQYNNKIYCLKHNNTIMLNDKHLIPNGTNVRSASAGSGHLMIIKQDGTVWGYGNNFHGQLGDATNINKTVFTQSTYTGVDAVKIVCGSNHTMILKKDGTVWGTGLNADGQLGLGNKLNKRGFTIASNINFSVSELYAHGNSSTLIDENFYLYGAGVKTIFPSSFNSDPTYFSRSTVLKEIPLKTPTGYFYRSNFWVNLDKSWPSSSPYMYYQGKQAYFNDVYQETNNTNWTRLSNIVIREKYNNVIDNSQTSTASTIYIDTSKLNEINAGETFLFDGVKRAVSRVLTSGTRSVSKVKEVIAVSENLVGVVKNDGKVLSGTFEIVEENSNIERITSTGFQGIEVSTGNNHIIVLTSSGNVYVMGDNTFGQLGGDFGETELTILTLVPNIVDVKYIHAEKNNSFIVTNSGEFKVAGENTSGQLGVQDKLNRKKFETVSTSHSVIQISATNEKVRILLTNGNVLTSGINLHQDESVTFVPENGLEGLTINKIYGTEELSMVKDGSSNLLYTKGSNRLMSSVIESLDNISTSYIPMDVQFDMDSVYLNEMESNYFIGLKDGYIYKYDTNSSQSIELINALNNHYTVWQNSIITDHSWLHNKSIFIDKSIIYILDDVEYIIEYMGSTPTFEGESQDYIDQMLAYYNTCKDLMHLATEILNDTSIIIYDDHINIFYDFINVYNVMFEYQTNNAVNADASGLTKYENWSTQLEIIYDYGWKGFISFVTETNTPTDIKILYFEEMMLKNDELGGSDFSSKYATFWYGGDVRWYTNDGDNTVVAFLKWDGYTFIENSYNDYITLNELVEENRLAYETYKTETYEPNIRGSFVNVYLSIGSNIINLASSKTGIITTKSTGEIYILSPDLNDYYYYPILTNTSDTVTELNEYVVSSGFSIELDPPLLSAPSSMIPIVNFSLNDTELEVDNYHTEYSFVYEATYLEIEYKSISFDPPIRKLKTNVVISTATKMYSFNAILDKLPPGL